MDSNGPVRGGPDGSRDDVNTYRLLWRIAIGLVGSVGVACAVVLIPPATMISVFITAALVSALVTATAFALQDRWTGGVLRRYGRNVMLGGAAGIGAAGLGEIVGGLAFVVVLLAALTSPPLMSWYAERLGSHRPAAPPPAYPDIRVTRAETLTIDEICTAWRQSCTDLRGASPAQALRFVEARQYYLDELERRDPDGLRAWLATAASASGDPSRYISRDR